jgi:putative membrane protein
MAKRLAALPTLAFILALEPLLAMAQQTEQSPPQAYFPPGTWHMWGDSYGWPYWWMLPVMMLFMLFMLLVCGALFFVASRFGHGPHHLGSPSRMMDQTSGDPAHSALQILNERFARGEIQKDEFMEKKTALLSGGPH